MERKRARKEDTDVERREKLSKTDLTCPICFDIYKEVHVTTCGHSFCHDCIERCLRQASECPVCKQSLPPNVKRFAPNFTLNDVVARVKADEQYHVPSVKSEINELLSQSLQLDEEDFKEYFKQLESRKKKIDQIMLLLMI